MMLHEFRTSLSLFATLAVITGVGYPLATYSIGQAMFPAQANGSLITVNDTVIGSSLIGQHFGDNKYFHSRPSAAGDNEYNAMLSAGTHMAVTSDIFVNTTALNLNDLHTIGITPPVPIDSVTASGSGLDPHISVAAAKMQIGRIAEYRGLGAAQIDELVIEYTTPRTYGFLGEPRVNVLNINRALDELTATRPINE